MVDWFLNCRAMRGTELAWVATYLKGVRDPTFKNYNLRDPREQGEIDGQRPIVARPLLECLAQGARTGIDLSRQRHQAAGPDRLVRSVRGPAQEQREPDGL